jgi:hypothetical protein
MAAPISYLEYVTQEGDMFDSIALAVYDDEFMAGKIIEENPVYADTIVFDAGYVLYCPLYADEDSPNSLPPWRK